jgi:hypothetical protein
LWLFLKILKVIFGFPDIDCLFVLVYLLNKDNQGLLHPARTEGTDFATK